ncbi:hypothetical protein EDD16DRAFT_1731418 [Pisolithus croceorrhizus]|nr:hypothetical protein EDD16DRAFT_1731418 [Pisolithus croceorrhizus]KAI6159202.1 hypothetical protein EDD17DRAFT_918526 [Pisolithus thermaeus]
MHQRLSAVLLLILTRLVRVLARPPDQTTDVYSAEDSRAVRTVELGQRQVSPTTSNPNSAQYSQAQTTTSVTVNLTPFGGTPIPWVPSQSLNPIPVTTSNTAGIPPLTGYPACVTLCLAHAAHAANCTSVIAVECYCSNPVFPQALVNCTAQSCIENLSIAENLAQQYCNVAAYSYSEFSTGSIPALPTSLSFPSPPATTPPPTFSTSVTPASIFTGVANDGGVRVMRTSMKRLWDGEGVKGAAMSVISGIVPVVIGALLV